MKALLFHLLTILFGYIMLYPLLWMFFSSFKENSEIFLNAHELLPKKWLFKNYIDGWRGFAGYPFSVFFKNSFIVTIIGTVGAVISSAIVAYGFARCKFKGKGFWFGCMIITMLFTISGCYDSAIHHVSKDGMGKYVQAFTCSSFFGSAIFYLFNDSIYKRNSKRIR